jgi:hypothetical protein
MRRGQSHGGAAALQVNPRHHDALHASREGVGDHALAVGVELMDLDMGVGVCEQGWEIASSRSSWVGSRRVMRRRHTCGDGPHVRSIERHPKRCQF